MQQELIKEILKARVYHVAKRTPLDEAVHLSHAWDNQLWIKREDLQPIFSFKIRGAANKIASLSADEKARGVICASAGNHGQGVALSAQLLGIPAVIVMPKTTPDIKVQAVARYGARIVLRGDHFSQAWEHCQTLVTKEGATLVHPFDDLQVIAGQGTIGREILEDGPDLDYIFVPVGGGGLLAGLATYVKYLAPHIRIIGVEPWESDAMTRSVQAGARVTLDEVGVFADGVAVKQVGALTFTCAQNYVDDFIRVTTDEICSAIHDIYRETRTIVEPAGALSWAGAKAYIKQHGLKQKRIATISSGANMSFQRLPFAAARALTGAGLESLFAIRLAETKGALKTFCQDILSGKAISEFNYRSSGSHEAYIFLGIATPAPADRESLHQRLGAYGYWYRDLTDNELAKEHVRHMVGGYGPGLLREELYSFIFPEREGALVNFLSVMSQGWNISLFHYRSHGSDFGRVLIAFEMAAEERAACEEQLRSVGYSFTRETLNPAYALFLEPRPHVAHTSLRRAFETRITP